MDLTIVFLSFLSSLQFHMVQTVISYCIYGGIMITTRWRLLLSGHELYAPSQYFCQKWGKYAQNNR